jgi:hypothetical protein
LTQKKKASTDLMTSKRIDCVDWSGTFTGTALFVENRSPFNRTIPTVVRTEVVSFTFTPVDQQHIGVWNVVFQSSTGLQVFGVGLAFLSNCEHTMEVSLTAPSPTTTLGEPSIAKMVATKLCENRVDQLRADYIGTGPQNIVAFVQDARRTPFSCSASFCM